MSQKILGSNPCVCRSYSGKTGRGPVCLGGPNLIKTFIKGKSFVAKKFSLGKIFVTWPIFRHFSPPKSFSADIMKIFDLS